MKLQRMKTMMVMALSLLLLALAACTPTGAPEADAAATPLPPTEAVEPTPELEPTEEAAQQQTLYVSAEQANCFGMVQQNCLLVKETPDGEYTLFFDEIAGFTWESGYEYELLVNVTELEDPPADASALQYELIEVVSQTAVSYDLSGVTWILVHTIVGGDAVVPAPTFAPVYFQIEDGMVAGSSGCNRFNGPVTIERNTIQFGPLATTRMACDEERMSLETTILDILSSATTFTFAEEMLMLRNANGLPLASFAEAEEMMLFVGPETAECVGVAPQQCLLVKSEPDAEYEFFYDEIAGFTWEAGYEYELRVGMMEVENPPADASSRQYTLLEIVSQTQVAEESGDNALAGTTWQWLRFEDTADLNNIDVAEPGSYTLSLMADGALALQADCNSGAGSYIVDGSSIVLELGAITTAACGSDSLDTTFLSRLPDVVTFVFDEDGNLVLNLKLDSGNLVFAPVE